MDTVAPVLQWPDANDWPQLKVSEWQESKDTLHMWLQILGKTRALHTPAINHWWHSALYLSGTGLSTSAIPYRGGSFEINANFIDHRLEIVTSIGANTSFTLRPMSVAQFHATFQAALMGLGISNPIGSSPHEVEEAIPFAENTKHESYDPVAVNTFWHQLLYAGKALSQLRSSFQAKSSPVHFFWGAMDLAVTQFSGRIAPKHPGGVPNCSDAVMHESYSRQLSSAGFWPGGEEGMLYSYAYPEPEGYREIALEAGYYDTNLGEFLLPWEEARQSSDPGAVVNSFLAATAKAASDLGRWEDPYPD